jgi:glycerol uptake facilitator-like aquaporin
MNMAMKNNGGIMTPLGIGLALTVAIFMFAPMGDCHFNPAVSFMGWCTGSLAGSVLAVYIIAQLAGAGAAWGLNRYLSA